MRTARVSPFKGLRAAPRLPLGPFICPPYDIIGPELARRLRGRKANAIAVELPGPDGYERARGTWRSWLESGLLVRDERPGYTLLSQTFAWKRRRLTRLGVFGALPVEPPGSRAVVAHEKTLSKPKKDRLRLLAALKANTSPIFGVVPDPGGRAASLMRRLSRRAPDHSFRDADGTRIRSWNIDRPADVRALERAFSGRPVLIADGHHRYFVSWRYSRLAKIPGARRILAYVSSESDPGLVVLPTHRVVAADAALRRTIERRLARETRPEACRDVRDAEARLARAPALAFGLVDGRSVSLRYPKDGRAPRFGRGLARLDVQWVKRLLSGVDPHVLTYVKDADEAARLAREGGGFAFLLKAPSLSAIREAVGATGLLPQKSTYFYPKVPTGVVFRELETD